MQIVIDIPEQMYLNAKANMLCGAGVIARAIKNGTPLPKGHKRLIEDNFEVGPVFDERGNRVSYKYVTQEDLNNAPTIVEADNAESEYKE